MQLSKTTTVVLSSGEIVQTLKKSHPEDLMIQALPSNGSGIYLELINAGKGLSLSWARRANSSDDVINFNKERNE